MRDIFPPNHLPVLRNLRIFVAKINEIHNIMKHSFAKFISVGVLFFLFPAFIWAQDSEPQEQTKTDTVQMYVRNAQYKQAVEYIKQLEPTKDLLYQKALCYKSMNDYSSAIGILDSLSAEYPEDVPSKLQLALCYEATSQYAKGIDCYSQLLAIDSANVYFEVRKADLFFRSEKYDLALDAYSRVDTTYNPNYTARCMAMCFEKLNQPDSAKVYYDKALEFNEQDAYSANSLVKIYIKNEDYLSAYTYSEKFIENDLTNTTMNALNAYVYYNLKYYDVAIERFEKCLQQGDSSLLVNRTLGLSYYLINKDSLARPFLQQSFLQDTTNNNVLYNLGKVNYNLGYYSDAVDCFGKMVVNLVPSNALLYSLYKSLAMSQEKNGALDAALGSYYTAFRYASDNADQMALYFAMANLSDKELKNYFMAISYYKEYRRCLLNYQNSLTDEKEVGEIETKLTALDEYLKSLMGEAEKTINSVAKDSIITK